MRALLLALGCLRALPDGGAPSPMPSPPPTAPERATDLFGSVDLAGWEYIAGAAADVAQVVTLKEGIVTVSGKPNGYLATTARFADYSLHVEWRWSEVEPDPRTNGGVLVHISSGPVQQSLWPTSFQIQLKVQRAGDVLSMGSAAFAETPTTMGTATSPSSTLARQAESSERPRGEWNSADITAHGASIEVVVNGVPQNRVAGCTPSSGAIGFQLEGHPFQLRNVVVRPLPVTGSGTAALDASRTAVSLAPGFHRPSITGSPRR